MPDQPVSRRTVAIALAGSAASAKLASALAPVGAPDDIGETAGAGAQPGRTLLSPLAVGSRLLSWEIVAIDPIEMGAQRVHLRGDSGVTFGIEILARDRSPLASQPPACTEHLALYVSNGGDGRMPTVEEQGLAAMALAQIVARNEAHVSTEGYLTHAGRIAEHPVALLDHVDLSRKPAADAAPAPGSPQLAARV
jgi:hypothetical protein